MNQSSNNGWCDTARIRTGCAGALGKFSEGRSGFGAARPDVQSWTTLTLNIDAVPGLPTLAAHLQRAAW